MKKLILALVAACCTAGMLRAQDVVPADTLKAQPVVATVESQPVVEEKAETPKEPKEFKGRRKYFNIGYAWEKLDAVDYKSKEESELAAHGDLPGSQFQREDLVGQKKKSSQ